MSRFSRGHAAAGFFLGVATDAILEFAVPRPGKQPIVSILLAQALASGMLAAGLGLWLGRTVGVSALLGGAVAVLPNAFLAARLLKPGNKVSAEALLQSAWLGEAGKLIMTAVLFAIGLRTVFGAPCCLPPVEEAQMEHADHAHHGAD